MASIGDLVANLTVDNRGFTKGLKDSRSQLGSFVGSVTSMVAPIAGTIAAAFSFGQMVSSAREAEEQQKKLASVLESTQQAVGLTADQISDYAGELQAVTNFEDDATIGAAALIATLGNVRGDQFKDLLSLTQDMASVMGLDLDTAAKKVVKTFKDLSESEAADKLEQMRKSFGGSAKAMADPFKQLWNVIGDIGESIGGTILPLLRDMARDASRWLSPIASMFGSIASHAAGSTSSIKSVTAAIEDVSDQEPELRKLSDTMKEVARIQLLLDAGGDEKKARRLQMEQGGASGLDIWQFEKVTAEFDKMIAKQEELTQATQLHNAVVAESIAKGFERADMMRDMDREIAVLTGEMSKQQAMVEGFLDKGFDLEDATAFAEKLAKINELRAAEREKDKSPKDATSSVGTELKASFKGSQEAAAIATRGSSLNKLENYAAKQLAETQKQTKATQDNKPGTEEVADF